MKVTILKIVFGFTTVSFASLFAAEVHTNIFGLDVRLSFDHGSYQTGTAVNASLVVSNETGLNLRWLESTNLPPELPLQACDHAFGLFDIKPAGSGDCLPCQLRWPAPDWPRSYDQAPNAAAVWTASLSREFGLTERGTYSVGLLMRPPIGLSLDRNKLVRLPDLSVTISDQPGCDGWDEKTMLTQKGPALEDVQVSVKLPAKEFALGAPVQAFILLDNNAATNRTYRETERQSRYAVVVKNVDGETVSRKGPAMLWEELNLSRQHPPESLRRRPLMAPFDASIPPHGRRWYDYRLDECFDLRKPGTYTLEIRLVELIDYDAWKTAEIPARPLVCGPVTFTIK